ncbi:MAG TPA: NAD(P)/FAD-dependent oxidoreductase, partial [Myxococcota bacterium]|nr:NAD(P)/FAD-dependent oxidoreductase [Myxococcota bacterium]
MVMGDLRQEADLVVIGAGPGGYVAALRAAGLGRDVVLVEERDEPGGVCLLEGCIPSKALINAVEVAHSAREGHRFGVNVGSVEIDLDKLRSWSADVIGGLTNGVKGLLAKRGVEVIKGRARFDGPNSISIEGGDVSGIDFKQAILATGSRPVRLFPELPLWTSSEAITLPKIPKTLAILGGGAIGLELGMVYAGLGSKITLIERAPNILPSIDADLVKVLKNAASERFEQILTDTTVVEVKAEGQGYKLTLEAEDGTKSTLEAEEVLVAVGRKRNTDGIGLQAAGIEVDDR